MFGTFFGHGVLALMEKKKFVDMFTAMALLIGWQASATTAGNVIFWVGILDVIVAFVILWKPLRILLIWGVIWGFLTALFRPMSASGWNIFAYVLDANKDNFWDLVERAANFGVPLALLYLRGLPKTWKELFE
jgi:hypothetical protein